MAVECTREKEMKVINKVIIENENNRPLFGNHTDKHISRMIKAELNKKLILREQYRINNEQLNESLKKKEEQESLYQKLIRVQMLKEQHRAKYKANKLKREEVCMLSRSTILSKEKPLYVRYKEKYENEVIPLMREEYNKKLEAVKMENRKCSKEELDEHSKLHKQFINQRKLLWVEKARRQKDLWSQREVFHSPLLDKVNQIDTLNKFQHVALNLSKKELRDREKNYSFCVQEVLNVVPSKGKIIELKEKISKLKHHPRSTRDTRNNYLDLSKIFRAKSTRKLHLNDSTSSINKRILFERTPQKSINRPNMRIVEYEHNRQLNYTPKVPIKSLSKRTIKRSPGDLGESTVKDIKLHRRLEEFSTKSPDIGSNQRSTQKIRKLHTIKRIRPQICDSWRCDLTNNKLNLREKHDLVTNKTRMMEDIVRRNEKLLASTNNIDLESKVNYMLMDTIKAKLSLFQQLNQ